jgi:hypothetical protein
MANPKVKMTKKNANTVFCAHLEPALIRECHRERSVAISLPPTEITELVPSASEESHCEFASARPRNGLCFSQ